MTIRVYNHEMEVSLKVGCLLYAVGNQPSISLIDLGRKWMLKMMRISNYSEYNFFRFCLY